MTTFKVRKITQTVFKPPVSRLQLTEGDTEDIFFDINTDISTWDFSVLIWDNSSPENSVSKQTAGLSGGSVDEIEITDGPNGLFTLKIEAGDTVGLDGDIRMEVQGITADSIPKKYTIYKDFIKFRKQKITT